jgi:hypothetical protein
MSTYVSYITIDYKTKHKFIWNQFLGSVFFPKQNTIDLNINEYHKIKKT